LTKAHEGGTKEISPAEIPTTGLSTL